jgi:hypothetical protein
LREKVPKGDEGAFDPAFNIAMSNQRYCPPSPHRRGETCA